MVFQAYMKNIDYCYYLFVEGNGYLDCFSLPREVETAWGPAIRAEEYENLIWSDEISVKPCRVDFLKERLPLNRRCLEYTHLELRGPFFRRTETPPRTIAPQNALTEMLRCVAKRSPTWALFVLAFCDDIESDYVLDAEQAIAIINEFINEHSPDLDSGFYVISK